MPRSARAWPMRTARSGSSPSLIPSSGRTYPSAAVARCLRRAEIDDRLVEAPQRAVMADADDGRPPFGLAQQAVERRLAGLVERRGRLVEKHDLRARQQHAGKAERCCSPPDRRCAQLPSSSRWSARWASPTACSAGSAPRRRCGVAAAGIDERVGQRAERQIRPLRQEQHRAVADPDAPRPNGHSPAIARSSVLLPEPVGPVISTGSPRPGAKRDIRAAALAVGQVEIERPDLDPVAAALDARSAAAPCCSAAIVVDPAAGSRKAARPPPGTRRSRCSW